MLNKTYLRKERRIPYIAYQKHRNYNSKIYNTFKKTNKFITDKVAPDPFKQLNEYGSIGKIGNKVANKLTDPIIHKASIHLAGKFYNPKTDKPYKGSVLYSIMKTLIKIILFIGFSSLIAFKFR